MMMGENLISQLQQRLQDSSVEFYIDTNQSIHIERLKIATGLDNIFSDRIELFPLWTQKIKYIRFLEKRIRRKSILKKIASYYDSIIILGGDDYSETYYKFPKDNIVIKTIFSDLSYLSQKLKVIMVGQTIGPFSGERIEHAKKSFEYVTIFVRDIITQSYLFERLNKESILSSDLAFLDLHLQANYVKDQAQLLDKYGLVENDYISVVGTGLINLYTSNLDLFVDKFISLLARINQEFPSNKIVYLSHVVNEDTPYNDNYLLDQINRKKPGFMSENCVVIREKILPVEARIIFGSGLLTISCRMHAAVSTFQMGKPAICLSYSEKFNGVIGGNLKCSELVINAKGNDFWESDVADVVMAKVDYVIGNRTELTQKIRNEVSSNKRVVSKMVDDLVKLILNNN